MSQRGEAARPAVRLSGVSRRFGATRALVRVDLEISPGEHVAVLGGNGTGKTTLMRIVAGLTKPTDGDVRVLGGSPSDRSVRARVGIAGHEPMLYPHLTALENVRLWAAVYGADQTPAAGLLSRLGIDPSDRRPVRGYSKGMRQRVSLARALVHEPVVLVLDEPFAGLDEAGTAAAAQLVADRAHTLVLTAHHLGATVGLTSRTVVLDHGRVRGMIGTGR